MRVRLLACLIAVLVLVSGCGGTSASLDNVSVLLDAPPNATHTGIYLALARDFDGSQDVQMRIRRPTPTTDVARDLESGRVDFAVLGARDFAAAKARGAPISRVMAITDRPVAGHPALLLAVSDQERQDAPRAVEGLAAAIRRGYEEVLKDPEVAVESIVRRVDGADRAALLADLQRVQPAFSVTASPGGES